MNVLKKIFFIVISIILFSLLFIGNKSKAADENLPLYLGIQEYRTNTDPKNMAYGIGNPDRNGSEVADIKGAKIWDIVKYNSMSDNNYDNTVNYYCVKAGIGFRNTGDKATYNVAYDFKEDRNTMLGLNNNEPVKSIVQDEAYYKILALADLMYIPGESEESYKMELITNALRAGSMMEDYSVYLTDVDVEAVQQAAIWYFTNYDDELFDNVYNQLGLQNMQWFTYKIQGEDDEYKAFSDYPHGEYLEGEQRQKQAIALYNYLINTAKANEQGYKNGTIISKSKITLYTHTTNGNNTQPIIEIEREEITGDYQIQLEKVDKDNPETKLQGAEFQVTLPGKGVETKTTGANGIVDLGTVEITDISSNDTITVEETKAPNGYNKILDTMTIEVEKQLSGDTYTIKNATIKSGGVEGTSVTLEGNIIKIVVANKKIEGNYQIQLEKVDKDNPETKLQGAEFQVTLPGKGAETKTTGANGIVDLGTVEITDISSNDTITVEETKAPNGYNKILDTMTIEVEKQLSGDTYTIKNATIKSGGVEGTSVTLEGNIIKIVVANKKIEGNYQIQLEKVDKDNPETKLQGAEFQVTLPGKGAETKTTGANGIVDLGTVQITDVDQTDTITIKETKAPDNYKQILDTMTVEVSKKIEDGKFVLENAEITSGEVEGTTVRVENGVIKIQVANKRKEFDLSLRKFITKVNDIEYDREPEVDITNLANGSDTTAIYNHPKQEVSVRRNDTVIYTIRVYNEGEVDGYANVVTDYLPKELEFLPDHEINKQYEWVLGEDGRTVTTDYLSKEKETEERQNLIKAFDGETLDYKDLQIACKIKEDAPRNIKLTNLAEITEEVDKDGEDVPDRDSEEGNVEKPTDEDLPGYKDDEIDKDYVPGQEDDDDFEKVIVKEFDLALRKYITKVNGENVDVSRNPVIDTSNLENQTDTTAEYKHKKDPVRVTYNDVVTYNITIYNEGDIDGRATKIVDQLPTGLKYSKVNTPGYTAQYDEETNRLELTKTENTNLKAFDGQTLSSETIEIECIVETIHEEILTNVAWISEEVDVDGTVITTQEGEDIDSEPGTTPDVNKDNMEDYRGNTSNKTGLEDPNYFYKGQQDDDDFEKLISEEITGDYQIQLEKVDKDNPQTKLQGAEFEVTLPGKEAETKTTDDNGIIDLGTVEITDIENPDTITIKETKAPDGYIKLLDTMTIEVEKQMVDGIYLAKSATITSGEVEGTSVTLEGNVIKIVVANKLVTGNYQLQLEKVDKDDPTIKLQGAEFNVTLPNGSEQTKTTGTDGIVSLGTVTITEIDNIDTITIEETKAPEGYSKLLDTMTIEIEKQMVDGVYSAKSATITSGEVEGTSVTLEGNVIKIVVANKKITGDYQVQLEKVDKNDQTIKLQGAEFEVTLPGRETETKTTGENGIIDLGTIEITDTEKPDTITIKETKAPDKYNKILDTMTIEISKKIENGNYVVESANIVEEEVEGTTVRVENGVIKIQVANKRKEFDLSLRKFITKVNDIEYDREPEVDITNLANGSDTTAIYNHPKQEVSVRRNDTVIYTIRVYNEGEVDGYANVVTDYLPKELEFLPDHEINKQYEWVLGEDGRTVTTDYLSKEKETEERQNLIKAFDGETLDYKDLQIACKIKEDAPRNIKLTNLAEITEEVDKDGEDVPDRDSEEGNVEKPTDEDLPGYKDDEIDKDYVPGQEDDDDFEKVIVKEFDLALRKFITGVDEEEVTTRVPELTYNEEEQKIEYKHTKEPVEVITGNIVTYTIRIYNEGDIAGYAKEVADDIPAGLEFLPENETNQEYRWVMYDAEGNETENVEEAVKIVTDYLSKEQGEAKMEEDESLTENPNLLKAYDAEQGITEDNPDYRDVKVAFKVVEPNTSDKIIINSAQIQEDEDENGKPVDDIDSTPGEWNEGEDDQDKEYIKLTYFDLALRKWVTQAIVIEDGKETITQTGHTAEMDPEPVVKVEIHRKKVNQVTVKFRYSIRVTNEGDIAGYAKEITDYVPEGLRFVAEDNPGWTDEGNNVISTRLLENTLLQPGESAEVEVLLTWINGENNLGLKTNTAEISEDYNEKGAPDIDSTPDNKVPGEDDIDDAEVILSISTGRAKMYLSLGFVILITLGGGVFLIKKYVL